MENAPQTIQTLSHWFLFLALAVSLLLHLIVYRGLFYRFSNSKIIQNILKFLIFINFIGTVLYLFSKHYFFMPHWFYIVTASTIGIVFLLFVMTIVYQILAVFLRFFGGICYKAYLQKIMLVVSIFYIAYGVYNGMASPIVQKTSLPIARLDSALKVVLLSDIHIGELVGKRRIKEIVQLVNKENPDLIALTGDIIDTQSKNIQEIIFELKNFKATYGVYYVLGNHEYMHDIDNIIKELKDLNFKVLINQNIVILKDNIPLINIVGVADLMGERMGYLQPDIVKSFEGINNDVPTILLSHQPKIIERIKDNFVELVLAGHTHGGQIFPFNFAVLLQQPYIKGLHKIGENRFLYINQGTGLWGPPMRIGSRSEITIIELLPKI